MLENCKNLSWIFLKLEYLVSYDHCTVRLRLQACTSSIKNAFKTIAKSAFKENENIVLEHATLSNKAYSLPFLVSPILPYMYFFSRDFPP